MSEATGSPLCLIQSLDRLPADLLVTGYHHLCDALAVLYHKRLLRQVDQYHTDFPSVIGINRTG